MIILKGLFNHCVLQRNDKNICDVVIEGLLSTIQQLNVHVMDSNDNVIKSAKLIDLSVGINDPKEKDIRYPFKVTLTGIPTGGPYSIKIYSSTNYLNIKDVLVGDLYLLAGQSNMQGVGLLTDKHESNNMARAFYMNDQWAIASDPIHSLEACVDLIHSEICGGSIEPQSLIVGTGPGVAIANRLYNMTGVPQGLIACAHGGTSMAQWSKPEGLYEAMIRRFTKNGGRVKGLFWYQGCNDTNEVDAPLYFEKMEKFIRSIRFDTNSPSLPIVAAQLSRVCYPASVSNHWNCVQHSQYELGNTIYNLNVIPTIDLEMDDFIHISGKSQNRLGYRMASSMLNLLGEDYLPPIKLSTIEVVEENNNWNSKIILTYDNVHGNLSSSGLASGFSLTDKPNSPNLNSIYKIELIKNQVILHTVDVKLDVLNRYLHYGQGYNPYCNIIDESDCSLPVIGSMKLGAIGGLGSPCTKAWCSQVTYSHSIDDLQEKILQYDPSYDTYQNKKEDLINSLNNNLSYMDYGYFFMNVFSKFSFTSKDIYGHLRYYVPFCTEEDLKPTLLVGSDSWIHIRIDGKEIATRDLTDVKTSPDNLAIPLELKKGIHIIQVDYIRNSEKGSGIFLRFSSPDTHQSDKHQLPSWIIT